MAYESLQSFAAKHKALQKKVGAARPKIKKPKHKDKDAFGGHHDDSHREADAMGYVRE